MKRMHKEVRELVDKAEMLGFKLDGVDGNGHYRLVCENGETVRIPCTPSEWPSAANSLAEMERKSGRKLPRQKSGNYRHRRVHESTFELSETERMGIARRDRIAAEAEAIRAEIKQLSLGPANRATAAEARRLVQTFKRLRELLEQNAYVIPGLSL